MHTKTKGDIGLLSASLFFAKHGFAVFKEIGDLSSTDLVVEKNNRLYRIQCKAFTPSNGAIQISFWKSGPGYKHKYSKEDFDFISVLNLENDKLYLIDSSYITDTSVGIAIRTEPSKNNQVKGIRFAEEFLAEKIIELF